MSRSKVDTLAVPGASLYYKIRGSGPLLLILQGGDGNADGTDDLANRLVDHYTIVTYDRRGLSRSPLADPSQAISLETHADDAHRLLAALSDEPALVFGGSLGALLGLDLIARYPDQVRRLVAHEPPAPELLPEAERAEAEWSQADLEETYRREGVAVAIRKMMASATLNFADREPDLVLPPPTSEAASQRAANLEFFLAHDVGAVRRYQLNFTALRVASTRIAPATGLSSRGTWLHQVASTLADRLGTELREFPGGHNGFVLRPRAFSATLRKVLEGAG
jgi:pimeloyl-ACP methyl ester carboxylesterase